MGFTFAKGLCAVFGRGGMPFSLLSLTCSFGCSAPAGHDSAFIDADETQFALEQAAHPVELAKLPPRGVWFWKEPGQYHGSAAIVGDPVREAQTLATFLTYQFERVYGSYDWGTTTAEADVASWNTELEASGRTRTLLMSQNTWIHSANWPNLQAKLQHRVVDFNAGVGAEARFRAVHFDVEPHALPEWGTLTAAAKRGYLLDLADMFQMVRSYLDAEGETGVRLYADLPVWFDKLPPALGGTGQIGWTSAADRLAWFDDLAAELDGITLMAFDRDTYSSIVSAVDWEVASFSKEVRIGLEADIGPGATWPTFGAMMAMVHWVESYGGLHRGVDIQSYRLFKQAIPIKPWPAHKTRRPGKPVKPKKRRQRR